MTLPAIECGSLRLVFVKNTLATQFRCGVFELRLEGQHVGAVSFVGTGARQARIGYTILPEFRRRGLASRAVAALIAAAPGLGFDALQAECRSNNAPSRRILEKSGFVLRSSAPFWTNGTDATLLFLVYQWLAGTPAGLPEYESCVQ